MSDTTAPETGATPAPSPEIHEAGMRNFWECLLEELEASK